MVNKVQLPNGWQQVRLGEVAEVNRSNWNPVDGSSILYLDLTAVIAPGILTEPKEIAAADAPSRARRRAYSGDILVSTVRPNLRGFARIGYAPENLIVSTGFAVLTPLVTVDCSFIYHHVMANPFVVYLDNATTGQAYPAVRPSDIENYRFPLPSLEEQRAIAAVLDSIDEAIERTSEVIASKEQLRDSLLHELLTHGSPGWHKEWKEVRGLGTIPACWDVARLGDVADVAFSSVDKKTLDNELPVELCNYTDVFYNRQIRPGMDLMAATATPMEYEKWTLKKGDVLFTKDSETQDEIGIPAYVPEDMPNVLCGYHLGRARPNSQVVNGSFLARVLGSPALTREFARVANGITRFGLTLDATRSLPVLIPPLGEQKSIASTLDGIDTALEQVSRERVALRRLKASTADALLTGRLRIALRK